MFGLEKVRFPTLATTPNSGAAKAASASKPSNSTRAKNLVVAGAGFWAIFQGGKDLASVCKKLKGTPATKKDDAGAETTVTVRPSKKELALPVALGAVKLGAGIVTVRAAFGK